MVSTQWMLFTIWADHQILTSGKVDIDKTTNLPNLIGVFLSNMTIKNELNGG